MSFPKAQFYFYLVNHGRHGFKDNNKKLKIFVQKYIYSDDYSKSSVTVPKCPPDPRPIMGLFDKLAGMLKVRKEQVNILVIGLNNSGKSTIVNHFKQPDERSSIVVPTVGFSVERFQSRLGGVITAVTIVMRSKMGCATG